eukprot:7243708-Alexandrium_andersonii.AAC.1
MLRQHLRCVPSFRSQNKDAARHLRIQGVHPGAQDEASRQDQALDLAACKHGPYRRQRHAKSQI